MVRGACLLVSMLECLSVRRLTQMLQVYMGIGFRSIIFESRYFRVLLESAWFILKYHFDLDTVHLRGDQPLGCQCKKTRPGVHQHLPNSFISSKAFGIVETVGGFLKICIVIGVGIAMYNLHSRGLPTSTNYLDDGISADRGLADTTEAAIWYVMKLYRAQSANATSYVIPILSYSFLGVESVAVTAFEARDIRSLRGPSRWIAWVVLVLYGFTLISELMISSWVSTRVPFIFGNQNQNQTTSTNKNKSMNNVGIAVIAAEAAGFPGLASFICGCLVFSVLSGANSALYVASRTLYGLARNSESKSNPITKAFKRFGNTTPKARVPGLALVASAASFYWLPFLENLGIGDTVRVA
jgi:yeast amino acid transporter